MTNLISQPGSVSLKLDSDGGHYASSTVAIPNGTYKGQLVIGDSFIHPVKKFTVDNSNDIIALQFDVEQGKESPGKFNILFEVLCINLFIETIMIIIVNVLYTCG